MRGLEAKPWWDVTELEWMPKLLRNVRVLQRDGRRILQHSAHFLPYMSPAVAAGEWADLSLVVSGSRQNGSLAAPASYELIRSLGPSVDTMVMGSAYFSRLSGRARLRPHCGPTNIRLRVHIGLSYT